MRSGQGSTGITHRCSVRDQSGGAICRTCYLPICTVSRAGRGNVTYVKAGVIRFSYTKFAGTGAMTVGCSWPAGMKLVAVGGLGSEHRDVHYAEHTVTSVMRTIG